MFVETFSNSFATWPFTATRQAAREAAANEIHWVSSVSCVLVTRFTRCRNIIPVKSLGNQQGLGECGLSFRVYHFHNLPVPTVFTGLRQVHSYLIMTFLSQNNVRTSGFVVSILFKYNLVQAAFCFHHERLQSQIGTRWEKIGWPAPRTGLPSMSEPMSPSTSETQQNSSRVVVGVVVCNRVLLCLNCVLYFGAWVLRREWLSACFRSWCVFAFGILFFVKMSKEGQRGWCDFS